MSPAYLCDDTKPSDTAVDPPQMGLERGCPTPDKGAKPAQPSLDPPISNESSPLITAKAEVEDEDDPLVGLSCLFEGFQIDDSDDEPDESSESDNEDEWHEAPPSPAAKGINPAYIPPPHKRTYFYAMGVLYFYDEERNVYLEKPGQITIEHFGGPFLLEDKGMLEPDFLIDNVPYFFDSLSGNLICHDQGTYQTVVTWAGESSANVDAFNPTFVPRTTGGTFQSNNSFAPTTFEYLDQTMDSSLMAYAKYEAETPVQLGPTPWSPGSSAYSPIMPSGSRASSEGLEPLMQAWHSETKKAQEERVPPSNNKLERRRCPQCNKTFRRPSSLMDHLNVHSGNKPHVCPFPNCKTGFGTQSNMKRHFQTHRVGTIEEYQGGKVDKTKSKSLTTTYNSRAFHTQRFRLCKTESS